MNKIPFTDFGGQGEPLFFIHANGFPPECYTSLIQTWTKQYKVIGIHQRPLWANSNYKQLKSWNALSNDLIQFIQQEKLQNVTCVGHSLGAIVSVEASAKQPQLFKQLVLLEPVLFNRVIPFFASLFSPVISRHIIPISKIALKRRDIWSSKQEMFDTYRSKNIFRKIDDDVLQQMVDGFLVKTSDNLFQLKYSKNWEAQIYATVIYIINKIVNSSIKISIARGEETDVITKQVWDYLHSKLPSKSLKNFEDSSHLLPFEKPQELGQWVMDQINSPL